MDKSVIEQVNAGAAIRRSSWPEGYIIKRNPDRAYVAFNVSYDSGATWDSSDWCPSSTDLIASDWELA